jgi:hypothetical protein
MTASTRRAALGALASASALGLTGAAAKLAGSAGSQRDLTTAEQWAAMNFEPLTIDEMPTYEEWCAMAMTHAVTLRMARLTLGKTKEEVKEIFRGMGEPFMEELFEHMDSAEKTFGHFHWVVQCAQLRFGVAGSAVELEDQA